jgi:hypothetical protein
MVLRVARRALGLITDQALSGLYAGELYRFRIHGDIAVR